MTAYRLDHVGVAVPSIDSALGIYEALGLAEAKREVVPGQKVTVAFLPVGESRVELLEPTSPDSPVAKFLEKRGGGVHHLCFAVDDLEAALADLSRKGYRLIPLEIEFWRSGAFRLHDRIVFRRATPQAPWTKTRLYP